VNEIETYSLNLFAPQERGYRQQIRKEHDEDVVGVCDKSGCRPPKYGPLPIVQKEITTEEEEVLDDEEH